MTNFSLGIVLLALATVGVIVRKTYYALPVQELKRQAEKHDPLASKIYPAVAYGGSLRALLWIFIGLTGAGGFTLVSREISPWWNLVILLLILWLVYSWLPASKTGWLGARLAIIATPLITWLLNYLHPLVSRGSGLIEKSYTAGAHTGVFEREDLLALIEQQHRQADNRISEEELEIARRALSFDDHKVGDILIPRKKIKVVMSDDAVGPILIDELHKSGQRHALVRETPKGEFVGSLEFSRLDLGSSGHVRDIMTSRVYYLHENDRLSEALHAFFETNHPVFVVVNSFEEYIGIITVENILHQLLGHVPGDEFDQYADIAAVAGRHAKAKKLEPADETPVKTDDEVVE